MNSINKGAGLGTLPQRSQSQQNPGDIMHIFILSQPDMLPIVSPLLGKCEEGCSGCPGFINQIIPPCPHQGIDAIE